jgi:hypothetical protein
MSVPTKDLRSGLYQLSALILLPTPAADPREPGAQRTSLEDVLFEIADPGGAARTTEQLRVEYHRIVAAREADFLAGIGDKATGALVFEGLLFVKNCGMQTRMRLGPLQLIPVGGLGGQDEITLISEFLVRNGQAPITNVEESIQRAKLGQPSFVAHFPRVFAGSVDHAGEIVKREGVLLCDVLALHRHSYGVVFGGVLHQRDTGAVHFWIDTPTYSGNLIGGALAGEFPRAIRDHLDKARANPRLALYLSLLREVLREERTEFAYFRFWNLLETIARSKSFRGRPRLEWSGTQKLSPKGTSLLIEDHAEQLVFELLRSTMASHVSPTGVGGHLKQGSFEELVPIWYRHRNCVVHGGGCFPSDPAFCLRTDPKYVKCREAHEEMVAKNGSRDRLNDEYLAALREAAIWIVGAECA